MPDVATGAPGTIETTGNPRIRKPKTATGNPAPLPDVEPHDVIVHVVAVANREVPLAQLPHPHPLVEVERPVVAVDVELHAAGHRMLAADILHGLTEEGGTHAPPLEVGQDVNLLEVEELLTLALHRDVAARSPVARGDEVGVPLAELVAEALRTIHPLHHVVQLGGGQNFAVGSREGHLGKAANQRSVALGGRSNRYHRCAVFTWRSASGPRREGHLFITDNGGTERNIIGRGREIAATRHA